MLVREEKEITHSNILSFFLVFFFFFCGGCFFTFSVGLGVYASWGLVVG